MIPVWKPHASGRGFASKPMVGVMAPPIPHNRIQPMANREGQKESKNSSGIEDQEKPMMSKPAERKKVVMRPIQRRCDAAPRLACIRNEDSRCATRLSSIHATGLDERSTRRIHMLIAATSRGVGVVSMLTRVGITRRDNPNPSSG